MITYLIGQPIIFNEELTLLVNGVGYGVITTTNTLAKANNQTELALHIYTHVKEDKLELYGFTSLNDKTIFKLLISVSGVGPATAISILNKGGNNIITAIQQADVSFFTAVKRVGKKAGQKIIIDLKSKLGGIKDLDLTPLNQLEQDIVSALLSLGFAEEEANQVTKKLELNNLNLGQAVKLAIKELGKNK